jgi:hypothetical protein
MGKGRVEPNGKGLPSSRFRRGATAASRHTNAFAMKLDPSGKVNFSTYCCAEARLAGQVLDHAISARPSIPQ